MEDRRPDQQVSKTEGRVQNTSELDRMVQTRGEDLQYVRSEVSKMWARVTYLESHIKQLKQNHDSAIARAHTAGLRSLKDVGLMDQHGFSTASSEECYTTTSAGSLKSLEIKVDSLQQAVVELEVNQQRSIQEAVACVTSAALQEIRTNRNSLSASIDEMHDAQINMEHHTTLLNNVIGGKQDHEKNTRRETDGMTLQVWDGLARYPI